MDKNTFKNVFDAEKYLYFYSEMLSPERGQKELEFLTEFADLSRPCKILDLACGHGRHANALARRGHSVTGMDLSPEFLELARKENAGVEYLCRDMRELSYENTFDRIFCLFTAIGYFSDEENELVFKRIYEALKPGGLFCFDSHNRDIYLTYLRPSFVLEKEGNILIDQTSFDTITGTSFTKRSMMYKGELTSMTYKIRLYNPTELLTLFRKIGFSKIDFYDGWEGKSLHNQSKRMVVLATK